MRFARIDDLDHGPRRRWAAGRVWAAHEAPYLASALLALDPVVVVRSEGEGREFDLRSFPADRSWHVYVDPDVLSDVGVEELGFWLLHQVSHLLRDHAPRFPGAPGAHDGARAAPLATRTPDQHRWNIASDLEINDDLSTAKLVLPEQAAHPRDYELPEGWTAEQYWDALGADTGEEPPQSPRSSSSHLHEGPAPPQATRDCGSAADGLERGWSCDRAGVGAVRGRLLARDTARQIREHTRERGEVPAGWQRWTQEILEPAIDWRRQLAAHIRRGAADVAGRVDFTYQRPSRRASAVPDVVLPSLRQPLPRVALVIDTSGSMSDAMLGAALGEVTGVLRSIGVARRNVRVIACDARAHPTQLVRDVHAIRLHGGGGTDMGAGLEAAAALRPRPDLTIVLTDGFTPWPSAPPGEIPVTVGLMDARGRSPAWAKTVMIGDAARVR
jgi:predicted metal-dependent peptidase